MNERKLNREKLGAVSIEKLRRDHMAHWCAWDHTPIRHNDSEHEQCPLCRMRDERDAALKEGER